MSAALELASAPQYFEIRLSAIRPAAPLPCDLYLVVNGKLTAIRRRGESLSPDRIQALHAHGITKLLVPMDQRDIYLHHIRQVLQDPSSTVDAKSAVIKESAFVQMQELFTNPNISSVVGGMERMLEDMVGFLSANSSAAPSLLRLSDHDQYAFNHSVNVAVYAILLTKKLSGIDPNAFVLAGLSALLHDVGKREIRPELVRKIEPLTADEQHELRQHPTLGAKLLAPIAAVPQRVKEVVLQHHENYDGTGYPQGLAGEQISQMTRIVAIADTFDALTHERPGQKSLSAEQALDLMTSITPSRLDPKLFHHFNRPDTQRSRLTLPASFDPCSPAPVRIISQG
jgi:putative nucleotidyltransferase with HDIG domain